VVKVRAKSVLVGIGMNVLENWVGSLPREDRSVAIAIAIDNLAEVPNLIIWSRAKQQNISQGSWF
jgi:hypothetical protein